MTDADLIPETRITPAMAVALVRDLARHGSFSVSERDQEDERDALRWLLAERERWRSAAISRGHPDSDTPS
jgi:DNA-binding MarR family transcriptional regulator